MDQPDWLDQLEQPAAQPAEDKPDWLKELGATEQPVASSEEQPDWLKGFENEVPSSRPSTGELNWLSQLGEEAKPAETPSNEFDFLNEPPKEMGTSAGELDWLSQLDQAPQSAASETVASRLEEDDLKLLNELGLRDETAAAAKPADDFDFMNELTDESEQPAPTSRPESQPSMPGSPGMSAEEQEDSFAWLENLAAKQGATEGLLTKPEDRLEEEPDWVKQAKGMDLGQPPAPPTAGQPPAAQPAANLGELGKSEQEQDDSFAWLESLAAKQGATEGLLIKPEERMEQEPEWVRQAKSMGEQPQEVPPAQVPPEEVKEAPARPEPSAGLEELGKSEEEKEDAFAWLESLAAKQGATEGLLTKPEERLEEEPEWVKQARDIRSEQLPEPEQPSSIEDTATWLQSLEEEETPSPEPVSPKDETSVWFKNLEERQKEVPTQPAPDTQPEELPAWMQNLEEDRASETVYNIPVSDLTPGAPQEESVAPAPAEELPEWMQAIEEDRASETRFNIPAVSDITAGPPEEKAAPPPQAEELPAWMRGLEDEKAADTDLNLPAMTSPIDTGEKEPVVDTEWMSAIEQESVMEASAGEEAEKAPAEELPGWLSELDQEQEQVASPAASDADLPSWLRDETGEVVAEPTRIEPTRATDWQPVESKPLEPEAQLPQPEPEPAMAQTLTPPPQPEPEPVMAQAEIQPPQPEVAEVVSIIEEKIAAVQEPEKPVAPRRERKPKGTGRLSMPLDPILGQARSELSSSSLSSALENYARLIKKGRFLDEVIYDLRDALYRFPVDVNIWMFLGDAYMRANRLQDALDAYTKAEELLR
jgi:hypothetical protein